MKMKGTHTMNIKSIKIGAVTYKSIKTAVVAAQKNMEKRGLAPIPYMTMYMRLKNAEKNGMTPSQAMNKPVRAYNKKSVETA